MDKRIVIEVNGSYLRKDSDVAGVQGEANVTIMNIIFDESWSGYAKRVTFWDARGENPVKRTLTTDLLTNITVSTLDYSVPIPGEPLVHDGKMEFVIEGYIDGVRKRTVSDKLKVKPSPMEINAEEPTDPTPDQAEQLQKQIDSMLGDMQSERIQAQEAKETAVNAAEEATASAESAFSSAGVANTSAAMAIDAAAVARQAEAEAVAAKEAAEKIREEVGDIAGGDFVTRGEFEGMVNEVVTPLKSDVTENTEAIEGLRQEVGGYEEDINNLGQAIEANTDAIGQKASQSALTEVDEQLQDHIKDADIHVTAEEKQKWNNVDFSAIEEQIAQLQAQLNAKAPMYDKGTEDLQAGVTPLGDNKLYFVYE